MKITTPRVAATLEGGRTAASAGRVLIVSNRLPFTSAIHDGVVELHRSTGGLAVALRDVHERLNAVWIGWAGSTDAMSPDCSRVLKERLRQKRAIAVDMSPEEVEGFYRRYANGVLWPILHDLPLPDTRDRDGWRLYRAMNERFADAVARQLQPGDRVWVHDYHLMLLPSLLRARVPRARIGFFLHTPVPSSHRLTELPEWSDLLQGLLAADVIGFHTRDYLRNFVGALPPGADVPASEDEVRMGERHVRLMACPVGTDVGWFSARARDPDVIAEADVIRAGSAGPLFVGIDRLDYTKGIPERLLAFERLLAEEPDLRGRARLVQIAVPTREDVRGYGEIRDRVELLVARINDTHGTVGWTPVDYRYGTVGPTTLVALYRAADVMLVTPSRDGMNLVAKEFVASRSDGDGVLVLSTGAGAAAELQAALLVDPADSRALLNAYRRALSLTAGERHVRMRRLRASVAAHDVFRWAKRSLAALSESIEAESEG